MLNFPFLSHYGIIVDAEKRLVADYGSRGKRYVPLYVFMANRKTYSLHKSDFLESEPEVIAYKFDSLPEKPFSWFTNNCVQFMSNFGRPDLATREINKFLIFVFFNALLVTCMLSILK